MRASRGPWGAGSAVNTPLVNLMLELWCFFLVFILLEHPWGVSPRLSSPDRHPGAVAAW